jgi:hypothetical protein
LLQFVLCYYISIFVLFNNCSSTVYLSGSFDVYVWHSFQLLYEQIIVCVLC